MTEFFCFVSFVLFQFLIGRLKTIEKEEPLAAYMMFQFLIGRLKTSADKRDAAECIAFQFLIGRLKTTYPGVDPNKAYLGFNSS